MKNTYIKKTVLVLTLATGVVVGSHGVSFADDSNLTTYAGDSEKSLEVSYEDSLKELKALYTEYESLFDDYSYLNASYVNKNYFDLKMKEVKEKLEVASKPESEAGLEKEIKNLNNLVKSLKDAQSSLDGKKVDIGQLDKLVKESSDFMRDSDHYNDAPINLRDDYNHALDYAKSVLFKGSSLSQEEYDNAKEKLMTAKDAIIEFGSRDELKKAIDKEIKDSKKIVEQKDKYTKSTYETYALTLKYAKSVRDNDKSTSTQLRDAFDRLVYARGGLISTDDKEAFDKKLAILDKAIEDNRTNSQASRMLLEKYPNTVKDIKGELEALIKKSDKLLQKALALRADLLKK